MEQRQYCGINNFDNILCKSHQQTKEQVAASVVFTQFTHPENRIEVCFIRAHKESIENINKV